MDRNNDLQLMLDYVDQQSWFRWCRGIGLHLRLQISQLEYHAAMGIITLIVVLVIMSETISHFLRERFR